MALGLLGKLGWGAAGAAAWKGTSALVGGAVGLGVNPFLGAAVGKGMMGMKLPGGMGAGMRKATGITRDESIVRGMKPHSETKAVAIRPMTKRDDFSTKLLVLDKTVRLAYKTSIQNNRELIYIQKMLQGPTAARAKELRMESARQLMGPTNNYYMMGAGGAGGGLGVPGGGGGPGGLGGLALPVALLALPALIRKLFGDWGKSRFDWRAEMRKHFGMGTGKLNFEQRLKNLRLGWNNTLRIGLTNISSKLSLDIKNIKFDIPRIPDVRADLNRLGSSIGRSIGLLRTGLDVRLIDIHKSIRLLGNRLSLPRFPEFADLPKLPDPGKIRWPNTGVPGRDNPFRPDKALPIDPKSWRPDRIGAPGFQHFPEAMSDARLSFESKLPRLNEIPATTPETKLLPPAAANRLAIKDLAPYDWKVWDTGKSIRTTSDTPRLIGDTSRAKLIADLPPFDWRVWDAGKSIRTTGDTPKLTADGASRTPIVDMPPIESRAKVTPKFDLRSLTRVLPHSPVEDVAAKRFYKLPPFIQEAIMKALNSLAPDWQKGAWKTPRDFFGSLHPHAFKIFNALLAAGFLFFDVKAYFKGEITAERLKARIFGFGAAWAIISSTFGQKVMEKLIRTIVKSQKFARAGGRMGGWVGFLGSLALEAIFFMILEVGLTGAAEKYYENLKVEEKIANDKMLATYEKESAAARAQTSGYMRDIFTNLGVEYSGALYDKEAWAAKYGSGKTTAPVTTMAGVDRHPPQIITPSAKGTQQAGMFSGLATSLWKKIY